MLLFSLLTVTGVCAATSSTTDEIEVEGMVASYNPAENTLTVGESTFQLTDDTIIITGRGRGTTAFLNKQIEGHWVSVSGYIDAGSRLIAQKVRVKPWINSPSENNGSEDDMHDLVNIKHPVALWTAKRFNLEYDFTLTMHETGIGGSNLVKAYNIAHANPETGLSEDD